jgi:hypothetical protein
LYDKRENGRIFFKGGDGNATDDLKNIFYSWFCLHDGATRTDMRKYQASAHYDVPERDTQLYSGLPCYNEIFYTPQAVRNRSDSTLMWKQLVQHWAAASRKHAKQKFDMPGMALLHGFLPPVKADKYVHTNVALELAVDTMAQMFKTLWDEWDYGGDINTLKEIYPYMRDMADFYAAYAKKGSDNLYHIIPSMQEESWGILPGFSHSRDTISAIAMFRWGLERAAEAAILLNADSTKRELWIDVANNLPPYPTWQKPEGLVYAPMPGVEPWRGKGEHPWYIGIYPTVLSDDINLDSDWQTKQVMLRTAQVLKAGLSDRAAILLGERPAPVMSDAAKSQNINDIIIKEPECLLNSRSGRIHLFPALPKNIDQVAFKNFQARGGFLISAVYNGSVVSYLKITSRRNVQCKLMNPWAGKKVGIVDLKSGKSIDFKLDNVNGECITFSAEQGKNYQVSLTR